MIGLLDFRRNMDLLDFRRGMGLIGFRRNIFVTVGGRLDGPKCFYFCIFLRLFVDLFYPAE